MKKTILMGVIIGAIAIAMVVASSSLVMPASAGKDNAREGLDKADENVHDNTELASNQDVRFHEGLCQGGHSTSVLDTLDGCEGAKDQGIIGEPGESDDNRQDD